MIINIAAQIKFFKNNKNPLCVREVDFSLTIVRRNCNKTTESRKLTGN